MALTFGALRRWRVAAPLAFGVTLTGVLALGLSLGLTPSTGADPWADECEALQLNPYVSWERGDPATDVRARLCDDRPSWLRNRVLQIMGP